MVEEAPSLGAQFWRHLSQPDRRLHCLDLAEERPNPAERMIAPMLEQSGGLWGNSPLAGIGERAPLVNAAPELINERGRVVLLLLGGKSRVIQEQALLLGSDLLLLGL